MQYTVAQERRPVSGLHRGDDGGLGFLRRGLPGAETEPGHLVAIVQGEAGGDHGAVWDDWEISGVTEASSLPVGVWGESGAAGWGVFPPSAAPD